MISDGDRLVSGLIPCPLLSLSPLTGKKKIRISPRRDSGYLNLPLPVSLSFSHTFTMYVVPPNFSPIPSLIIPRNSTLSSGTYWGQFEEIGKYNTELNVAERLWAAWYAWMQNDVLATGIMSFVMHETVYFGRSLPWVFIDTWGLFNRYKIQGVSLL